MILRVDPDESHYVLDDLEIICNKKAIFDVASLLPRQILIWHANCSQSTIADALIQAVEEISERKIQTWLFLGPILPEITDSERI